MDKYSNSESEEEEVASESSTEMIAAGLKTKARALYGGGGVDSGCEPDDEESWIDWHCGKKGNEMLVKVDLDFASDCFNLIGLEPLKSDVENSFSSINDFSETSSGGDGVAHKG